MLHYRRPYGVYERYFKRPLDCVIAVGALIVFAPLLVIIAMLVKLKLGSPVIFAQMRPGLINHQTGKEKIFKLYKFRTMTDERNCEGELLPDEMRLTGFGAWLRSTSLDELPELFNILKGDMAIVGPRPQLVRDMVFMSKEQRERHTVRPGLTGLAQIRGRNTLSWGKKLNSDLEYIEKISMGEDFKIILTTFVKVLLKEGISEEGQATALDLGDELLRNGLVSRSEYNKKQEVARLILRGVNS